MDSQPEAAFDRLTRLAANLLGTPVALVSLVDDHRQFFKSAFGLEAEPWASRRETPLSHSFCQYVTRGRDRVVVGDAREDPRLRDNLAIRDLHAIAYAGMPLIVDDEAIGAFCVIDDKPRVWSADKLQLLEDLAASVVSEIELRMALQAGREQRALKNAIVESIGDACLAIDPQRMFIIANQSARRIFAAGVEVGKPLPADWSTLNRSHRPDGSEMPSNEGALGRALAGHSTDGLVFTLQGSEAVEPRWVEACGRPVRDDAGTVIAGVAVYRDITDTKQQIDLLRQSEQIHRAIVEHLPNGAVFMIDRDLRYVSADGSIPAQFLRLDNLKDLVGRHVTDVVSQANSETIVAMYRATFRGERRRVEVAYGERSFDLSTVPILDGATITHVLVSLYDVTDRKREAEDLRQARDSLFRERALLEVTLAHSEDGVVLLNSQSAILLGNRSYAAMFGVTREMLPGMTRAEFVARVAPLCADPAAFIRMVGSSDAVDVQEFEFLRPRRRILRRTWTPVELVEGTGYLVRWHDVTAERDLLKEREHELLVDGLTGIPNRRAVETVLRVEQERMKRSGVPFCVAVFDVDHFKHVNDRFGHGAGDDVLRGVAGTLAAQGRLTDTVGRWGGEEFVAVLGGELGGARTFCERARRAIERMSCPPVERITISVGTVEVTAGENASDAIARADKRLYEAKIAGRNRVAA
jgi:diguanylate cyclase (GGDEF)-like protein